MTEYTPERSHIIAIHMARVLLKEIIWEVMSEHGANYDMIVKDGLMYRQCNKY